MVRPSKMAVLLLSVHPLLNQCLIYLYPTHLTDLPTYLPQVPANDWSSFRLEHLCYVCQRSGEGCAPLLVSLVTDEPT